MRQMRNVRTGKLAVYDADLVESGKWEEVLPAEAKKKSPTEDEVGVTDEIQITVTRGKDEGKQRKA